MTNFMLKNCITARPDSYQHLFGVVGGGGGGSHLHLHVYRGSYMSAHVLLNLLNELGKRGKM